jgi:hypothetical protein
LISVLGTGLVEQVSVRLIHDVGAGMAPCHFAKSGKKELKRCKPLLAVYDLHPWRDADLRSFA